MEKRTAAKPILKMLKMRGLSNAKSAPLGSIRASPHARIFPAQLIEKSSVMNNSRKRR